VEFRIEQRFDLPVEVVEDILYQPGFIQRMAELPKLGRPQLLSREVEGDELHTRIRYAFAGELSSAVRRVVDPRRLTWVQEATTDRQTHRTDFRILPDHYAHLLHAQGTFTLRPSATGSLRTAEGEVRVSVPFVAGRVERAIVSGLEEHARGEVELVEGWVAGEDREGGPGG